MGNNTNVRLVLGALIAALFCIGANASTQLFQLSKNSGETTSAFWNRCGTASQPYVDSYTYGQWTPYTSGSTPPVSTSAYETMLTNCRATYGYFATCFAPILPGYMKCATLNTTAGVDDCVYRVDLNLNGLTCTLTSY